MVEPLWMKDGVDIDTRIMRFLAGDDVVLDRALFLFDIEATRAHIQSLTQVGIFDDKERDSIYVVLDELAADFSEGRFVLDERFEDGHTAIENRLSVRLGDTGRKVHTGRSRNDQVLVATRLFLVRSLSRLTRQCKRIAAQALKEAARNTDIPMPGYTHMQRAVVSSLGLWYAAIAEAFIDNAELAAMTRNWINANPLGTAAGYGVNLDLDREDATRKLGFGRLQINPLYTQTSRGKFELQALMALAHALLDVRRLAWELSLYTSSEFGFVALPDRFTTGSSIMPQKRNPDLVELLRSEYARTQGAIAELQAVLSLPAGYHRDLQATKAPLLRAMSHGLDALALIPDLLGNLAWHKERLANAIEPSMYTTDRAIELAQENVPFRDAYRRAAGEIDSLADRKPLDSINARISSGAPGNLQLDKLEQRLSAIRVK